MLKKVALVSAVAALAAYFASLGHSGAEGGATLGSGQMFDKIAATYDIANKFMSLGLDKSWRVAMVDALNVGPGDRVLDLATGTADVAILHGQRGANVLGIDPSANMLAVGRTKVAERGLDGTVVLELGDAQALEGLADGSFDKITISFGIRNVPDRSKALREMRRVAAPNATLGVMEFCVPEAGPLAPLARFFIRRVVPVLGSLLSGAMSTAEYEHLQKSITDFPPPAAFAAQIEEAGFKLSNPPTLFACGSVALYVAQPRDM
ncbi:ubiE/COQ5 methyltransferase family-domain-containing protein [Pelagophyceae sp. CCMP2097]|nr:ubiE/COQ5 methyltransferase family-domain-containing protein [Pelagophyceae sp. CCMP2097]